MSTKEPEKPEICQYCNQAKVALPEKTEKQGLTVWVCAKPNPEGKNKVPCDGTFVTNNL